MVHYAIGDVHGCLDELRNMYDLLGADYKRLSVTHPHLTETKPTIVMLGDYIDRGPNSKGVVNFLITKSENDDTFNWVFLRGNHEDMMYNDVHTWMYNGGRETVESYINVNAHDFNHASTLVELVGARHDHFYRSLKNVYVSGKLIFVHAGIDPQRSIENQAMSYMLWSRDLYNGRYYDGCTVVHGHTPVLNRLDIHPNPANPNRVNLDAGCVFGGKLMAVRFNDENNPSVDEMFFVSNKSNRKGYF